MNINPRKPAHWLRIGVALLPLWMGLGGCQTPHHLTAQNATRLTIDGAVPTDSSTLRWLAPYKQGLDKNMNETLVNLSERLDKTAPESALTDLLADALLAQATQRYGKPIDVAHLNYGGIRSGLPAGALTTGNIFEVMPFDNQLVVLTLTADQLNQFMDQVVAHEGSLVVGGVHVRVANKKTTTTLDNGRTIGPGQTYAVAMSDYVANGGGGADFLKTVTTRQNSNYLIRDALIDYFRAEGKNGKLLSPKANGRITIE